MTPAIGEMTFAQLVTFGMGVARDRPDTIALWETRIARALAAQRPAIGIAPDGARAHRCNLARAWCSARGLPSELVPRTLVCEGVRHALGLLLEPLARGAAVALPSDVYPVYHTIARERGVAVHAFATWPELDLVRVLDGCARAGTVIIILPLPLKLHARSWNRDEVDTARGWLRADRERRLILDGVYSFGAPIASEVLELLETDQVIYLDSMSKGWLHEQTLGVAVVPAKDGARLADMVRAASPSTAKLLTARELLERFGETPAAVKRELDGRRERLLARLDTLGVAHARCERGYLVSLDSDASTMFETHGVLALPASVFGSTQRDRAFASALSSEGPP